MGDLPVNLIELDQQSDLIGSRSASVRTIPMRWDLRKRPEKPK
jgi:hypothetical protein